MAILTVAVPLVDLGEAPLPDGAIILSTSDTPNMKPTSATKGSEAAGTLRQSARTHASPQST